MDVQDTLGLVAREEQAIGAITASLAGALRTLRGKGRDRSRQFRGLTEAEVTKIDRQLKGAEHELQQFMLLGPKASGYYEFRPIADLTLQWVRAVRRKLGEARDRRRALSPSG